MHKFILIEHSLRDLGGHYYTYAYSILKAAEKAGFQPVLAANQSFRDTQALPGNWQVHAIFPHRSSWIPAYGTESIQRTDKDGPLARWKSNVRRAFRTRKRLRLAKHFAAATQTLLRRVSVGEGDHVFVSTASDIDLEGLSLLLHSNPATAVADWHLQFHHPIFRGREPDYPAQSATRAAVRSAFVQALARIPSHRIHLHCTTQQLTAQYEFLDVAPFRTLPYAIHALFSKRSAARKTALPARIACLGHTRMEKGYGQLPTLISELWDRYLGTGRAQLILQTGRAGLRKSLNQLVSKLGQSSATPALSYSPSPLDLEKYAALVHSIDVGLLLYDGERYYARCSGVLLEMLIAGVPVVVPAGSWLSEQIAEQNQRYLEELVTERSSVRLLSGDELSWTRSPATDKATIGQESRVQFSHEAAVSEFQIAPGNTALLLEFSWLTPSTAGTYLRLTLAQSSEQQQTSQEFVAITGSRTDGQSVRVLFGLQPQSTRIRLSWRNAWANGPVCVADVKVRLFIGGAIPVAAIGTMAAGAEQIGASLDEVLTHLEHYRSNAASFATRCAQHHNADQIVAQLTAAVLR